MGYTHLSRPHFATHFGGMLVLTASSQCLFHLVRRHPPNWYRLKFVNKGTGAINPSVLFGMLDVPGLTWLSGSSVAEMLLTA